MATAAFPLARMSGLVAALTAITFPLPLTFVAGALVAPPVVRPVLFGVAVLMALLYVFIAVWLRPLRFEVGDAGLTIVWPLRSRTIPRARLAGARVLDREALRQEIGTAMRVGAGGLFGGFGLARTSRGWMELWVSRTDWVVLVEVREGKPLLVTPSPSDAFVDAVRSLASR